MLPIWIKICGITRTEDADAAAALGVDAIGLVFYPDSPRAVAPERVTQILANCAGKMQVFALFVDPHRDQVEAALRSGPVTHLQFHGSESPEFCDSFGMPYMKAFRVRSAKATLAESKNYASAQQILLDSYLKNVPGGTGKTFDWAHAAKIVQGTAQRVVLAGGLHPYNVVEAVSQVRPFGVDISSGVEAAPGIKDLEKLQQFVEGVRSVRA